MKKFYLFALALSVSLSLCSCGKKDEMKPTTEPKKEETSKSEGKNEKAPEATGQMAGKLEMLKFDRKEIPSDIKYKGRVMGGAKWKDANGENLLIITETEIQNGKDKEGNDVISKEIFGYNYILQSDGSSTLWQINDFVKECEFDLFLNYHANSLTITDLNDNGIAESTFLYRMSCKSDVSPDELKLMMHEGKDKYALRGENQIKFKTDGKTVTQGGDYKVDASFDKAPKGFLDYAREQWSKFKTQELN
jgi:hypothetical protein